MQTNMEQPVLVIGGTRGTGMLIARLLHRRAVPVRVLARDRTRAVKLFNPTIDVISGVERAVEMKRAAAPL